MCESDFSSSNQILWLDVVLCCAVAKVKSASDYVKDANTDIEHAIESSKKIRKRQCCMIIIVLIIIALIVIVLFASGIV